MVENHDNILGQLTQKVSTMRTDMQGLQERTKTTDLEMAKTAESRNLILAKFAGKPERNPVADLKMVREVPMKMI